MNRLREIFQTVIDYIFVYPKSTTSLVALLIIVILIALYVNRKRDGSGRVSFVDRGRHGIISAWLFRIADGKPVETWRLPLWAGERGLRLKPRIMLPAGLYGVRACWNPDDPPPEEDLFAARDGAEKMGQPISDAARFTLSKARMVGFELGADKQGLSIDSPEKAHFEAATESQGQDGDSGTARPPLPLAIPDSSLKGLARMLAKGKKRYVWTISVMDNRVVATMEKQAKTARRKLDGMIIKNKDLEGQLAQVTRRS